MYEGNIPGRKAIMASRVGLIKIESAINAGCIEKSWWEFAGGNQSESDIRTIPKTQPLSNTVPKMYWFWILCQR
jgi:hypothetical protein